MAKVVGFSPSDAKRIAEAVRNLDKRLISIEQQIIIQRPVIVRSAITGRLTSTLARGGTATFAVYQAIAGGHLGAATGETYDIIDTDELATDMSPLAINVRVTAVWCDGVWKLVSFDCDLEVA